MASFDSDDLRATVRTLKGVSNQLEQGNDRALPGSHQDPDTDVYGAVYRVVQQPAAEGIIFDPDTRKYYLARRIPGQQDFGAGKVHIFGGWLKPYLADVSPMSYLCDTGRNELGTDFEYLAGPIFTYAWQRNEHPVGFPLSMGYVIKPTRIGKLNDDRTGLWYDVGDLPTQDEMIRGRAGELHFMFLRAFFKWVRAGGTIPCIDLNQNPL